MGEEQPGTLVEWLGFYVSLTVCLWKNEPATYLTWLG